MYSYTVYMYKAIPYNNNNNKGAGVLFGPDVTERFCEEPVAAALLV